MLQGRDLVITTYGTLVSDYSDGSKKGPLYATKVTHFMHWPQMHQVQPEMHVDMFGTSI